MKQSPMPATFTLRIPRGLKDKAEARASEEHMSINTWILRVMERAVRSQKVMPVTAPTVPASSDPHQQGKEFTS